nr:glycosyltransferase [Chloroflexota bacterium]
MELSVVIPAWNEADNLVKLLPQLHAVLSNLGCEYEVLVVDNHSADATEEVCRAAGVVLLQQNEPGYGGALWAGFGHASGEYILTMDADLSHTPDFIPLMWNERAKADVIVASRYVEGGSTDMPWYRHILSIILNRVYTRVLSLPIRDISSGFRLYRASILRSLDLQSKDFDALEEILIECYAQGYTILEMPMHYMPREQGKSKVKLLRFGIAYLNTLFRMWKLRNSINSADYDARAFDSVIPLQRYWQRRRYAIILGMLDRSKRCLDVGCGSSHILRGLSADSIGLDIKLNKLRCARRYKRPLVNASAFALPFGDGVFDQVLCSEVIEHLEASEQPFREMNRVLKKRGRLVIGTPDYGSRVWPILERLYKFFAPGAYADEHITHYTRESLLRVLQKHGFQCCQWKYIWGAELIASFTKGDCAG